MPRIESEYRHKLFAGAWLESPNRTVTGTHDQLPLSVDGDDAGCRISRIVGQVFGAAEPNGFPGALVQRDESDGLVWLHRPS